MFEQELGHGYNLSFPFPFYIFNVHKLFSV